MRASTGITATALLGMASAQTVHVVDVSSPNGTVLAFSPNRLTAGVGDIVQFNYQGDNHSVAQSVFDFPCEPLQLHMPNETGVWSGFKPVTAAGTGMIPTYNVTVTDVTPIWLYCAQDHHCQAGMSMVINEDTATNSTRSLDNYQANAALVANSIVPSIITIGNQSNAGLNNDTAGTIAAALSPQTLVGPLSNATVIPGANSSDSGSDSGSSPGSSTSTGSNSQPTHNLAAAVSASAWTGLLSLAAAITLL
ncbi:hypothetical protein F4861DRAFT_55072 [Xylaria intraflava]|nr:hypothetical protein F4861DRAFT_55072 [Xylaria intraflava]